MGSEADATMPGGDNEEEARRITVNDGGRG